MKLESKIFKLVNSKNYIPLTKEEMAISLDIPFKSLKTFFETLNSLIERDKLQLINSKIYSMNYRLVKKEKLLKGKIEFTPKGNAFFISEDENIDDIFIPKANINRALHNDEVNIEIIKPKTRGNKAEGKVVEILNRNTNIIVGTFYESKNFGFVVPDNKKFNSDIFIAKGDKNGAKNDYKVVCKITEFPEGRRSPEGVVIEVLGDKNDKNTQIISLLKDMEIPYQFPSKINTELELLETLDIDKEIKNRVDFRNLFTVTIDGRYSKDFDDAISIEKKGNDYVLYVHIADVSYYVKKDSKIDREAYKRGNSVYLLDFVAPMLPEVLSNGLCSLNPGEDRLTISLKMIIGNNGNIKDYKFYEAVINSNYRLIYDEVTDYLENNNNIYKNEELTDRLNLMRELHDILFIRRKNRGTIDFEFPELEFVLDESGEVEDIKTVESGVANRIIESFMICANEVVGKHFADENIPLIYRVHKKPTEEKLELLQRYFTNLGINCNTHDLMSSKYLSGIIEKFKDTNKKVFVNYSILRSMNKAMYSKDIDIHFGLANMFYCHFTSPIRRYADLTVHRTIKDYLHSDFKLTKGYLNYLDITANHVTHTEILAIDAERKLEDIKKAEFMKDKIGNVYEGIIISITSFGMFVQLENTVEGLIRYESMTDDYYVFDENTLTAVGRKKNNSFDIGMKVEVVLVKVDELTNEIDFLLNR